jgi:hypothetical protein
LIEGIGDRFDLDRSPAKIDPHDFAHAGVTHVASLERPWGRGLVMVKAIAGQDDFDRMSAEQPD